MSWINNISQGAMYFVGFIVISVLLAGAAYLELYQGIIPCPLCMMQRVILALIGIVFLFGIAWRTKKYAKITLGFFASLFSAFGVFISARQVWLQHIPVSEQANCDVSLQYMLNVLPLSEVIKTVFAGGASCSQIGWSVWHLSLAEWSLLSFIGLLLFSLWQLFRKM